MTAPEDYINVDAWLRGCHRPLLLTHRRPDGDALGALTALAMILRERGQDPQPTLYEALPARYAFIADAVRWRRWDTERPALIDEADGVVIVDTCARAQLEPVADWLDEAPRTLVIDHHPTPDAIGTRAGDLRLLDQTAGAACLLVAEWAEALAVRLSGAAAQALFTGLATDCGWFRFSNTNARAFRAACALTEAGAQPNAIHRRIYQQDAPARLRLIGRMLGTLKLHANDQLAIMTLRQADFMAVGANRDMSEDLVNEAGRLGCTEATILFTEEADGRVRVNLRSKERLDVAALAARFGGGGHVRAAGARPEGAWNELVERITAAAVAALERASAGGA